MKSDFGSATGKASIYSFILVHLDEHGRLPDSEIALPDETPFASEDLMWAAGAMDGTFGHHAGGGESRDAAEAAARAFLAACAKPTEQNLQHLYEVIISDNALDFLDALIDELVAAQPDRERLHDVGRWLATTASDRGAVKVGIAMLGVTGLDQDIEVVRALGAHEEFTLFAAVALSNDLTDPEQELWALARAADGWGRIQCVERLSKTTDPAIRGWILREGFRNSVMYEYLAYIAATTGGLLEALRDADPDRDLLTAAGEILEALIDGGPAEDITDYEDGADAVESYLSLMASRAETLDDFHAVASIRTFLAHDDLWNDLEALGWSADRRVAFEHSCDDILERDEWIGRIEAGMESSDPGEYRRAEQAAKHRHVDVFDIQLRRIRENPYGNGWFAAWQDTSPERADQLARLATELLPLHAIATGPRDEAGLGPRWQTHNTLGWSLQALRHHAGIGADLILAGLQSPVVRNRSMSLKALDEWPRDQWPSGAEELASRLAAADPCDDMRPIAGDVLAGTARHDDL